ncbi:aminopeptidase [Paenibacillus sp. UNCCL117]|uniref:aminopeptidase n=1 Tax=unclassified Paenibacillus TaxID=185978 RepID=UPI00088C8A16|nr:MULTISPECIES: aminopeptidase [unclassified Paenibacillus]SDD31024.1 PepS aminopeptidase. Metallo peptidase. MEROPS family M29 [Paenibacillus sp. cl123]SFW40212.1 aminopeptidase [Paenibacillus sp. UNCCL117]
MSSLTHAIERYAELAVSVGINVQPGQTLVIQAPLYNAEFVRLIAKKAYEAGAKNVQVEWDDDELKRMKYMMAPDEAFEEYPAWKAQGYVEMAGNDAAFLTVYSPTPDLLRDVKPERLAAASKAYGTAMREYRAMMQAGRISWAIVSAPSPAWARKVFPDASPEDAERLLWEHLLRAARAYEEHPVEAWRQHLERLRGHVERMNAKRYARLIYRSPGTELSVDLPPDHQWVAGGIHNAKGTFFVPNIPTEELFTLPHRDSVNGTVSSTMPLNWNGQLIDKFSLTFEHGLVTSCTAETGLEALQRLIATDPGAARLGEVALVPQDSPISNMKVLFYNTGLDENASCHFALGNAYPLCLKDGSSMSREELDARGANFSIVHVDFMIGSDQLDIDGVLQDGTVEPVFRSGNWA